MLKNKQTINGIIVVSLLACSLLTYGMDGKTCNNNRLKHYEVIGVSGEQGSSMNKPKTAFTSESTSSASASVALSIPTAPIQATVISAHQPSTSSAILLPFSEKQFPLHWAAATGDTNLLKRELEKGEDPNELDSNRRSPFHYASANGHVEIVQLMCEQLTKQNKLPRLSTDANGLTPAEYARKRGNQEMLNLFSPRTFPQTHQSLLGQTEEKANSLVITVQAAPRSVEEVHWLKRLFCLCTCGGSSKSS